MFRVTATGLVRTELLQLYSIAQEQGRGVAYALALKSLNHRLATAPQSLGEPTFRFHEWNLTNQVAIIGPLAVEFCIDEVRKIVYIRKVTLTSA